MIEVASLSDVGQRRRGHPNEDSCLVLDGGRTTLVVVADGMGGAASGELASALAVSALRAAYESRAADSEPRGFLDGAARTANRIVYDFAQSDPRHEGAGTTLVAALAEDDMLWVAHVGDSRAYVLRGRRLVQITRDHSYVQEEVEAGRMTRAEARRNRHSNVITRAVGIEPEVNVEITPWKIQPGDIVLLCSDGLHGPVDDSAIASIMLHAGARPAEAARRLVDAANAAGGPDNVTVVVMAVPGSAAGRTAATRPVGLAAAAAVLLFLAVVGVAWRMTPSRPAAGDSRAADISAIPSAPAPASATAVATSAASGATPTPPTATPTVQPRATPEPTPRPATTATSAPTLTATAPPQNVPLQPPAPAGPTGSPGASGNAAASGTGSSTCFTLTKTVDVGGHFVTVSPAVNCAGDDYPVWETVTKYAPGTKVTLSVIPPSGKDPVWEGAVVVAGTPLLATVEMLADRTVHVRLKPRGSATGASGAASAQ